MRYETPAHRRDAVRKAADALRAARRVVLTTHVNADGDGTGSQVAVAAWLRALGAEAWIVNPTPFPDMFRFMVPHSSWVIDAGTSRAEEMAAQADLAVVLDTGETSRIGRVKPLIDGRRTVVVDHHPPGDKPIGGISLRDPDACATGELVYDLMTATDGPWPDEALVGMYVAILTDTGGFRFSNSTPGAHRVVADLVERGVDPEAMYEQVYGRSPLRHFKLLEASLATLDADEAAGVAWMVVPRRAYDDLGAEPDDLEGMVDYPRSVEGTEVGLLFRQTREGDTKVSFRSNGSVDVNALARRFDGGGHVKASGALLKGPPERVVPRVVDATREAVRRHRAGAPRNPGDGGTYLMQDRNPAARSADPGVPEALPRALAELGGRFDPATLETVWIFPPLVRGRREWGLVAASRIGDAASPPEEEKEERRTLYTVPYTAERTGQGLFLEVEVREQGQAPPDRLPRVMDGVVRRSGDDLGDPREVKIDGDPERFAGLMDEFDPALLEEPAQPMQASEK